MKALIEKIWRAMTAPKPDPADLQFDKVMALADDVTRQIRERAHSINPFRAVLSEMLLGKHPSDPFVIADAFEAAQESNIYRGLKNGKV